MAIKGVSPYTSKDRTGASLPYVALCHTNGILFGVWGGEYWMLLIIMLIRGIYLAQSRPCQNGEAKSNEGGGGGRGGKGSIKGKRKKERKKERNSEKAMVHKQEM